MNSFGVRQKVNRSIKYGKQVKVTGVPMMIVDGTYIIESKGSFGDMLKVVDHVDRSSKTKLIGINMKNKRYLLILPLCALFLFNGKKYDESVIERIHLNVNICIEGQDCGAVLAESAGSDAGLKSNKTICWLYCLSWG